MIYLRGKMWHYEFTVDGVRYRGTTGCKDKREAEKVELEQKNNHVQKHSVKVVWEQTRRKFASGNSIKTDFDTAWGMFLKLHPEKICKARTYAYRSYLKNFCEYAKRKNLETFSDVLSSHAREWFSEVNEKEASASTKNLHLHFMKFFFRLLGTDYGIVENPFQNIKTIEKDEVSREAFTPEELKIIGENAKGWIYSLCLTALSTGLREGDICMMMKSSVNLDERLIECKTRKTGSVVSVPIMNGLYNHLRDVMSNDSKEYTESEYVFPFLANMYSSNKYYIGKSIKNFFEEIGISGTRIKRNGRNISVKDVHSFRHTFVYLAAVNGIPFPIVQDIVGHASPEMTKHYMDHASRQQKADFMSRIPNYLNPKSVPEKIKIGTPDIDIPKIVSLVETLSVNKVDDVKKSLLDLLCV